MQKNFKVGGTKMGDLGHCEGKTANGKEESWSKAKITQGSFNGPGKSSKTKMKGGLNLKTADDFQNTVNAAK